MTLPAPDWSTQQLAEFVATVSKFKDEASATRGALERAAEAFEAEVGAIVHAGGVVASVGFPQDRAPRDLLVGLALERPGSADIPGLGRCVVEVASLEGSHDARLLLARAGDAGFTVPERTLLRGMARVLSLTLEMIKRQVLLQRLSKIQRSISHRAPLQEVLDAITAGAAELMGVEVAGLRLLDPDDATYALTVSAAGVKAPILDSIRRTPVHQGAGGRAILEDALVIIDDYEHQDGVVPGFANDGLKCAMAAPVREEGALAGSLVVASYQEGRSFSESEQEVLLALAEHASLALTDAKTVDGMREAQRAKDLFLAMVSHELKTPLTVIMGTLRTLEVHGSDLAPELAKEMLSSGWERGRELERLINRLLQGARAELAGAEEDIGLRHLVAEAVKGFHHSRRIEMSAVPDVVLRLDRPAILEVMGILLENAVAHSPAGELVRLDVDVSDGELAVAVTNPGALPGDVEPERLFHPFQRGGEARSPGVGLGLYIAGRVAESIDGRIDVRSADGRVCFTLRVPASEAVPAAVRSA